MKCPISPWGLRSSTPPVRESFKDCLKEECAWWEQDLNLCAIKELALELRYTQLRLADMEKKMPHKGQFRGR